MSSCAGALSRTNPTLAVPTQFPYTPSKIIILRRVEVAKIPSTLIAVCLLGFSSRAATPSYPEANNLNNSYNDSNNGIHGHSCSNGYVSLDEYQ